MIPVDIVTGFLGSGKTTLLAEVLARPEFGDTAVIVNEFGAVGLDHLLLEAVEEGVLLLASGCICCTIRSDLKDTIRGLQDKAAKRLIPAFRGVMIETTGLADPGPIVSTLAAEPVIRNHFRLGTIVCTVDGMAGAATLARHPEAVKQIAVADRILITKADLAEEQALVALADRIDGLNPTAAIGRSTGCGFDADLLFGAGLGVALRREAEVARWFAVREGGAPAERHAEDVRAFVLSYPDPIDWIAFGVWLTALLHAHGTGILRVKGLLHLRESGTPVAIHGVQHVVHAPVHLARWPDADRTSRIVFITRGVAEDAIRASLESFLAAASGRRAETPPDRRTA